MKPVLLEGTGVEISTYALMLSLGACLGFWLTWRESERKGSDTPSVLMLAALALAGGMVGARGLATLLHGSLYAERPWWSVLMVWDRGGMTLYGGLALAGLLGLGWIAWKRLPAWDTADTLALAWTPFLSTIRVGCFLNGCCYGRPTMSPLALVTGGSFDNARYGVPSHPAQLYAVAATLLIFGILMWMRTRRRFEGQLAVTFLGLYGVFRFFHEFVRGDVRPAGAPVSELTFNQVGSLVLVLFAVAAAFTLSRRARKKAGPEPRLSSSR